MVFLYNNHPFNYPSVQFTEKKSYKKARRKKKAISTKRRLKQLTSRNKKILLSLGFKVKKRYKQNKNK